MDLVAFDERRVATEDVQPRFWIEVITHVDSPSPSVASHLAQGCGVQDVLTHAASLAAPAVTRVNVYVLVGAEAAVDLQAVRIATF